LTVQWYCFGVYPVTWTNTVAALPTAGREMSTGKKLAVLCGREGNRRSGAAQTIRYWLWYVHGRLVMCTKPAFL